MVFFEKNTKTYHTSSTEGKKVVEGLVFGVSIERFRVQTLTSDRLTMIERLFLWYKLVLNKGFTNLGQAVRNQSLNPEPFDRLFSVFQRETIYRLRSKREEKEENVCWVSRYRKDDS